MTNAVYIASRFFQSWLNVALISSAIAARLTSWEASIILTILPKPDKYCVYSLYSIIGMARENHSMTDANTTTHNQYLIACHLCLDNGVYTRLFCLKTSSKKPLPFITWHCKYHRATNLNATTKTHSSHTPISYDVTTGCWHACYPCMIIITETCLLPPDVVFIVHKWNSLGLTRGRWIGVG